MSQRAELLRTELIANNSTLQHHSMDSSEMKRVFEGQRRFKLSKKVQRSFRGALQTLDQGELNHLYEELHEGYCPIDRFSAINPAILLSEMRHLSRRNKL